VCAPHLNLPSSKLATTGTVPGRRSGLIRIVPRWEQQNPQHEEQRKDSVNLKFRVVQRKRKLTANAIELR
jgi:hypothetical protein